MTDSTFWSWTALAGLGAFHGLNPGMGWLFAVALGMQEGHRRAVWRALVPLGLGHLLAIGLVLTLAALSGLVIPEPVMRAAVCGLLIGLGGYRLVRHRHPRWGGMRVSMAGLTMWSFLMASAHGAGLMVLPLMMTAPHHHGTHGGHAIHAAHLEAVPDAASAHASADATEGAPAAPSSLAPTAATSTAIAADPLITIAATAVHTAGYLIVAAFVAWIVFERLGLGVLRRAWINLDLIWAGALVATGLLALW
jgi:hypothetical protein